MMFQTIIANLDRRPDRWHLCLGGLFALGYNPRHIHRCSAHDGDLYHNYEHARDAAAKQYPNSNYICENPVARHYFCWSWTWYEMMAQIAAGAYGHLVLIMVDDIIPFQHHFTDTSHHLDILRHYAPLKCVQLSHNSQPPGAKPSHTELPAGEPIPDAPFTRTIHRSGDVANILTPAGAAAVLSIADNRPRCGVPNWVFWWVARDLPNQRGYYAALGRYMRTLIPNPHVNNFQDGAQLTSKLINA